MFDNTYKHSDTDLRVNALWRATELAVAMLASPDTKGEIGSRAVLCTAKEYYTFLKGETK